MPEDLNAQFEKATKDVTALSQAPDNDVMLKLYGLYKQATKGDCTGARPGLMDFVGRAKYDSWKAVEGATCDDAKQRYIDVVNDLIAKDNG